MHIKIDGLCKTYGVQNIFHDYCACFEEGRITCIVGPSGCGKTTLLRILAGIEEMNAGTLTGINEKTKAVVFQEDRLCEHLSVKMNLRLVCEKEVTEQELEEQLTLVGLKGVLKKRVSLLSGGMKRRVAIVRAMIVKSDLLLMDEPFKGLDEELKKQVIQYVREKSKGKTLLVVLHEAQEVELLQADKVERLEMDKK